MFEASKYTPYALLAAVLAVCIFLLITWVPAAGTWFSVVNLSQPLPENVFLTWSLLWGALFDVSIFTTLYTLVLSLLIGTNIALFALYYKKAVTLQARGGVGGLAGIAASVLGFGCASCGTLFVSLILTSVGGAGLSFVPFLNSYIFQIVGVGLILFSIYELWKKVTNPLICPI